MAEKSFLLASALEDGGFRFPNIDSLTNKSEAFGFGQDTESKNPLSHQELANNLALPFSEQFAKAITEDTTITAIDHDLKLSVPNGVTVTLPTSNVKNGIRVTFIPNFNEDTNEAFVKDETHTWKLEPNSALEIFWNGRAWKSSEYTWKENFNRMTPTCYTGRDLRKVFFDLGEIVADSYEDITIAQIVAALHARCDTAFDDEANRFAGLGLGDYFWLGSSDGSKADGKGSITLTSASGISNPDSASTKFSWGYDASADTFTNGYTASKTIPSNYTKVVIMGFDTYYNMGEPQNTKHHITFQFERMIWKGPMNTTDTSTGGFAASSGHQFMNNTAGGVLKMLNDILGEAHIMSTCHPYRTVYNTDTADWTNDKVFLPSVVEVFGAPMRLFDTHCWGDSFPQWALYSLRPDLRLKLYNGSRWWWWSASLSYWTGSFVSASHYGYTVSAAAFDADGGFAPAFNIC